MKKRQKIPKVTATTPIPPPPMTRAQVEDLVKTIIEHEVEHLKEVILAWKEKKFQDVKHPTLLRSDLEWFDSTGEATCKLEVYSEVLRGLNPEDPNRPGAPTVGTVYEYALDKLIDKARFPSHSSSYMSNTTHIWQVQAWGQVVKELKSLLSEWEDAVEREGGAQ